MTVTFFGHSDTPSCVRPVLLEVVRGLVEKENAQTFYVGHNGGFDALVASVLKELQEQYPSIHCFVILSRMPEKKGVDFSQSLETIFPERVARALPRFAINERNRWMIEHSDAVITYITHSCTNAAKWGERASRMGKRVISLVL